MRAGTIKAIIDNYKMLLSTLEEINTTGCDEYAMKAGGFVRQLQLYTTFFGLKLCMVIFVLIEQLSHSSIQEHYCSRSKRDCTCHREFLAKAANR